MARTILVVDDELDVRTYLRTLLRKHGYIVEVAENGDEGLERARAVAPDLVLLDIMMPRRSGLMLYRRMQEDARLANVPVVILSGVAGSRSLFEDDVDELPRSIAFVEKPPDPDELLALIRDRVPTAS